MTYLPLTSKIAIKLTTVLFISKINRSQGNTGLPVPSNLFFVHFLVYLCIFLNRLSLIPPECDYLRITTPPGIAFKFIIRKDFVVEKHALVLCLRKSSWCLNAQYLL